MSESEFVRVHQDCPGKRAVPLRVLAPIVVVMVCAICTSFVAVMAETSALAKETAAMKATTALRAEKLDKIEDNQVRILQELATMKAQLGEMHNPRR